MHAFEVETVEKRKGDYALDIDVLPNRAADCFSHQGIAREANAILSFLGTYELKDAKPLSGKEVFNVPLPPGDASLIHIENGEDTPYYALAFLDRVNVGSSPDWLKRYLQAVGLEPICNVVDIANFVMLDIGQPLHIFDADKVALPITVRRARRGECIELIGGAKKELSYEDIVIADTKQALGIAGIKGGQASAVNADTSSILIEAAQFSRESIYKSSKRLNLITDAAKRFSVGFAFELAPLGLARALTLLKEIAGGKGERVSAKEGGASLYHFFKPAPPIRIEVEKITQALGVSLKEETVIKMLGGLGFLMEKETGTPDYKLISPFWRRDIAFPEDITEEVGRLYGFTHIASSLPAISLLEAHESEILTWRYFLRHQLVRQGFSEVYNYSLQRIGEVELINPPSEKRMYLRASLIPALLENAALNQSLTQSKSEDALMLFEIGNVFTKKGNILQEREKLCLALVSRKAHEAVRELKGHVESLLESMGFDREDYFLKEEQDGAALIIAGALAGCISIPAVPSSLKVKGEVAMFEGDIEIFISHIENEREFEEPPKFPAVERDISLFLTHGVKAGDVVSIIHEMGSKLIEDVDLFDMYEDERSPKRSLAFRIMYRSKEKTLTDEEVNALHKKIEQELAKRLKAEVR